MGFFRPSFKRDPYGTLNPEQQGVTQALGPYLQSSLGRGVETYGGQLTEPISDAEQASISNFSRLNAVRNDSLSSILGATPQQLDEEFTSQVQKPSLDFFKREIQPMIEETLPTFSTARAQAVGREATNLAGNLATQRFQANQLRRDQALNASGALNEAGTTSLGIAAVPRELKQLGLDRSYQEYVRGNTQRQNSINQMLSFLGISTVSAEETPSTLTTALGYGKSIAQIIAALKSQNYTEGATNAPSQPNETRVA